jgi:hypothetical protein
MVRKTNFSLLFNNYSFPPRGRDTTNSPHHPGYPGANKQEKIMKKAALSYLKAAFDSYPNWL